MRDIDKQAMLREAQFSKIPIFIIINLTKKKLLKQHKFCILG